MKPGVKRSETPGWTSPKKRRAREAADSGCVNKNVLIPLSAAPRASDIFPHGSWGFAALHPRLYAVVRSADLEPAAPRPSADLSLVVVRLSAQFDRNVAENITTSTSAK